MPPKRCIVTMAGNSFIVTVSAPNAPCRQTQNSVNVGHHGEMSGLAESSGFNSLARNESAALCVGSASLRCARRCSSQVVTASVKINTPTPVAR